MFLEENNEIFAVYSYIILFVVVVVFADLSFPQIITEGVREKEMLFVDSDA
jgi:hypothetical protein